ncbi:hypothetical protein GCM10010176_007520 [Nonomuraea spiralis]|nr:hypothetical protein GCM10010176_007520 [Nonomuraea spiralis]
MLEAQPPLRVTQAEGVPVGAQVVGVDGQHADAQRAGDALSGQAGAFHAVLQRDVQGPATGGAGRRYG